MCDECEKDKNSRFVLVSIGELDTLRGGVGSVKTIIKSLEKNIQNEKDDGVKLNILTSTIREIGEFLEEKFPKEEL